MLKNKFINWLASYWDHSELGDALDYDDSAKEFRKSEIQSMFVAWKAGRRSKQSETCATIQPQAKQQ